MERKRAVSLTFRFITFALFVVRLEPAPKLLCCARLWVGVQHVLATDIGKTPEIIK